MDEFNPELGKFRLTEDERRKAEGRARRAGEDPRKAIERAEGRMAEANDSLLDNENIKSTRPIEKIDETDKAA